MVMVALPALPVALARGLAAGCCAQAVKLTNAVTNKNEINLFIVFYLILKR
jgi:hypothetical protein